MTTALKRASILFLLFVIAGAVSFCLFNGPLPIAGGGQHIPSHHDGFMAHILRIQELTSATTTVVALAAVVLFLLFAVIAVVLSVPDSFLQFMSPGYLRQKRREGFPVTQRAMRHWLSLFEGSPNVFTPA